MKDRNSLRKSHRPKAGLILLFIMLLIIPAGFAASQTTSNPAPKKSKTGTSGTTSSNPNNTNNPDRDYGHPNLGGTLGGIPGAPGINSNGSGSGSQWLGKPSPIVVAICVNDYNYSSDCYNKTIAEATKELTKMMLREYVDGRKEHYLRLMFPSRYSNPEIIKTLKHIEKEAIKAVTLKMKEDIKKLEPFKWDTKSDKQAKLHVVEEETRKVNQWNAAVMAEANSGTNWTRSSSSSNNSSSSNDRQSSSSSSSGSASDHKSVLDFHAGKALEQARFINLNGWKGQ